MSWVGMRNLFADIFRLFRRYPVRLISKDELADFFKTLNPINNGHNLIRIGSNSDGGYLSPDDLHDIDWCISPGVALNWDFEEMLWCDLNIPSYMLDYSVDLPSNLKFNYRFEKKFIGTINCCHLITIDTLLEQEHFIGANDLLLQMDIEGDEYLSLLNTSERSWNRFRIAIIEFHNLDRIIEVDYFENVIKKLFVKIFQTHDIVHLHANNAGGTFKLQGVSFPKIIELTLHRKDRLIKNLGNNPVPNPLDVRNSLSSPEIPLNNLLS
jgi:hypothetical protein